MVLVHIMAVLCVVVPAVMRAKVLVCMVHPVLMTLFFHGEVLM